MDPVTLSLLLGGGAAKIGGGILGRDEAAANAAAQAQARNDSLAKNIGILNGFGDQNAKTLNTNLDTYAPAAQSAQLGAAQTHRSDATAGNITDLDPNGAPNAADASPAVRSEIAKRMLAVHGAAVDRAKATGKLGGYTDLWAQNQLDNQQASRDIGVTNNYAEGRKSLVGPEGDLAAAAAYKPPSIWGQLLSGAGSLALSAAGGRGFGAAGGGSALTPSSIGTLNATDPGDI